MYHLNTERNKKSFYAPPTRNNKSLLQKVRLIEIRKKIFLLPNVIGLRNNLSSKYIKSFPIKVCISKHVKQMLMRIILSTDDGVNDIPKSLLFLFLKYLWIFFITAVRRKHTNFQGFSRSPYICISHYCLPVMC